MIKKCGCGRHYDHYSWVRLPYTSETKRVTHKTYKLRRSKCHEWKQCLCGSTLVTEVICDCGGNTDDSV